MTRPITPQITANVIIEFPQRKGTPILLIERKYSPYGWAIPGGFVEVGETISSAAHREALEETGLDVHLDILLGIYSDPNRDLRGHSVGTVFIGSATGVPHAADDAMKAAFFDPFRIDVDLALDHRKILDDYCLYRTQGIIKIPE